MGEWQISRVRVTASIKWSSRVGSSRLKNVQVASRYASTYQSTEVSSSFAHQFGWSKNANFVQLRKKQKYIYRGKYFSFTCDNHHGKVYKFDPFSEKFLWFKKIFLKKSCDNRNLLGVVRKFLCGVVRKFLWKSILKLLVYSSLNIR